jgi:hypothetical protein
LPADAQALLLVAAADGSGQIAAVRRAAAALGVGDQALEVAERSGLIRIRGPELRFRHPLVRSAIYGAATLVEQQRVHRVLAASLSGDLDRRTWHLAQATQGLDDGVAADLDAVAGRAQRRGGHEAASAAWERAAELTTEAETRARRLQDAAMSAWLSGQTGRAHVLAEDARRYASDPLLRSDIDRLRARLEWNVGSAETGQSIVLRPPRRSLHSMGPGRWRWRCWAPPWRHSPPDRAWPLIRPRFCPPCLMTPRPGLGAAVR